MRASRLLSMLLMLHTRGRVSAQEFADEFEISLRTVYRDLDELGAAGIPVYATRGRAGGYQLLDGYRTRLTGLTGDEADALFLAGLPAAARDLGLGPMLAGGELKLLAALPPALRMRAERTRDRVHVDAPGWERAADSPPHLSEIAAAVWDQRRIEVRYQLSNRSVVDRTLEPLGLVLKAGVWYAVAVPVGPGSRSPRTYRLSRVQSVATAAETFERPDGFELAGFWTQYQRDYEARLFKGSATIRLSERGRQLLFLIGSVASRAGHAAMQPADDDGWATTTVPIESIAHAQHALQQLGAEVEVLEPADLRAAILAEAQVVVRRYTESDGGVFTTADDSSG